MAGDRRDDLRTLVANVGFEVMPFKDVEHKVVDGVNPAVPLTVTTTTTKGLDRTLEVTLHLRENGYAVAPHLPARLFRDDAHVATVARMLVEHDVQRIFVVGGDAPEPVGEFYDALALLESLARSGHTFDEVGIGGYPEGHPNFSEAVGRQAFVDKAKYADKAITQMCFDAQVTTRWATEISRECGGVRIHVGMPGPVNRQKLIRISASLGLGTSARFLQKQNGFWRFLMPGAYSPTRLLNRLAAAQPPGTPVLHGIHLFTFNELDGAQQWLDQMRRDVGLT